MTQHYTLSLLQVNKGISERVKQTLDEVGVFQPPGLVAFSNGKLLNIPQKGWYFGETKSGQPNGFGALINPQGELFEGFFNYGLPMGNCRLIDSRGTLFTGKWASLQNMIKGQIKYSDGSLYEGEMEKLQPHGRGHLTTQQGVYTGVFVRGGLKNPGQLNYSSGTVYQGNFEDFVPNGLGKITFANGLAFQGSFVNGQGWDEGSLVVPGQYFYKGEVKQGKRDGKGTCNWDNGEQYVGQWKNDKMWGKGSYTFGDGRVQEGHWADDVFEGKPSRVGSKVPIISIIPELKPDLSISSIGLQSEDILPEFDVSASINAQNIRSVPSNVSGTNRKKLSVYTDNDRLSIAQMLSRLNKSSLILKGAPSIKINTNSLENSFKKPLKDLLLPVSPRSQLPNKDSLVKIRRSTKIAFDPPVEAIKRFPQDLFEGLPPFQYPSKMPIQTVSYSWLEVQEGVWYKGEWDENGNRSGRGIEVHKKTVYEGSWLNNMRHGAGREITKKALYNGYWSFDTKHGFGHCIWFDRSNYAGDWAQNVPNGQGVFQGKGERYAGSFVNGAREGKGVLDCSDVRYVGDFRGGLPQGFGKIIWREEAFIGIFFEGRVVTNKGVHIHGAGQQRVAQGRREANMSFKSSLDDQNSEEEQKLDIPGFSLSPKSDVRGFFQSSEESQVAKRPVLQLKKVNERQPEKANNSVLSLLRKQSQKEEKVSEDGKRNELAEQRSGVNTNATGQTAPRVDNLVVPTLERLLSKKQADQL